MKITIRNPLLTAIPLLLCVGVVAGLLGVLFRSMKAEEPIYPGAGVTAVRMLSDWYPGLANGDGDTEVYVLEGKKRALRCSCSAEPIPTSLRDWWAPFCSLKTPCRKKGPSM